MEKGKENVNGFMRRILFIYLGKKNDEDPDPHHCIADNTIKEYKEFFKSDIGGCWEEKEENSELVDLNLNATNKDLREEIAKLDNFCYSIIVYVGHGNSDDDNDYIQISDTEKCEISELYTPKTKKRLLIIDACRCSQTGNIQNVDIGNYTHVSFPTNLTNKSARDRNRDLYNKKIKECNPHIEIIQSTKRGCHAHGFTNGTDSAMAFSYSLIRVLYFDKTLKRFNDLALYPQNTSNNTPYNLSYLDICEKTNNQMGNLGLTQKSDHTYINDKGEKVCISSLSSKERLPLKCFPLVAVDNG